MWTRIEAYTISRLQRRRGEECAFSIRGVHIHTPLHPVELHNRKEFIHLCSIMRILSPLVFTFFERNFQIHGLWKRRSPIRNSWWNPRCSIGFRKCSIVYTVIISSASLYHYILRKVIGNCWNGCPWTEFVNEANANRLYFDRA